MLMIIVKVWCSQGSFKRLSATSQIGLEFDLLVFEASVIPGVPGEKKSSEQGREPTTNVIHK